QMVNTRTDAELAAAVQNALQTLLPQIRTEIREEFRTGFGPSEFKELFFLQFFPRAEHERLKREYHSIRQTDTETSTEFMQCFL
nr:zinc finger, CCHC-type, retrotransposon Gag domain protein [Tanacetum cinerariifolium]